MRRSLPSESPPHKDHARLNAATVKRSAALVLLAACAHFPSQPQGSADYWGLTGPWDSRSDRPVEEHGSSLARIVTGWIALDTASFLTIEPYGDSIGKTAALSGRTMALI